MKSFKQFQEETQTITEIKKRFIGAALLAAPYLAKKFLKPKTDKMLDKQRKTNKIGGDRRSGGGDFGAGKRELEDALKNKRGVTNKTTKEFMKNPEYEDFFRKR